VAREGAGLMRDWRRRDRSRFTRDSLSSP